MILFSELQPKVRGWLLGCVDGKTTGLLPANHVKVLGKRRGKRDQDNPSPSNTQMSQTAITPSESALSLNDPAPMPTTLNSLPENDLDTMFQEAGSGSANMEASDILENCDSGVADCEDGCAAENLPKKDCCAGKAT